MMSDRLVEHVVDEYLGAADAEAPNLVEGLYLEGSVALGDFRPFSSDIDFVAITAEPLEGGHLVALERVHRRRKQRARPSFDGIYVTWQDLRRVPLDVIPGARSHEGEFQREGNGPLSPVTWHTIARYGVTCRGPRPTELGIRTDFASLARWTDENLERYWRRLVRDASNWRSRWGLVSLTTYATLWIVSGISRLHYTLATGDIISKEGACRHALTVFPQWQRVIGEALRIRQLDRARPTLASSLSSLSDHVRTLRASPHSSSLYPTAVRQASRRFEVC